ncbi:hypothetical protein BGZ96_000236, partial [Linnemannia gamsii]
NPASPIHPATPTSTPIHGIHPMAAHFLQVPYNNANTSTPVIPEAIDTGLTELSMTSSSPPPPPPKSALDRSFAGSSSPPTSSPLRRSSVTPSSHSHSSDTTHDETIINSNKGAVLSSSPSPPPAAGVAAVTASSTKSRRSSKLFGKLVPKFLQTSFGPNNPSGGSSSPRSAVPTSPSPLSAMARPARSASFTGSTTVPSSIATAVVVATGSSSGSLGGGALPTLPELPALSNSVLSSNEDWLGLHNSTDKDRKAPSPVLLSASPIATSATIGTAHQQPTVTSQFSMSIVAIEEREQSLHSNHSSTHEFRTYNEQLEQERPLPVMPQDGFGFQKQDHPMSFNNYNQYMQHEEDSEHQMDYDNDDSGSPYIIDENCDDDFFLNSVLRKKSSSSSSSSSNTNRNPNTPSTRPYPPPLLSTGNWRGSASGATPSLSAASGSSSSQTSSMAPSPTSPFNPSSSSMYTPTPTPVSATPHSYRSSSITNGSSSGGTPTQMIQPGLDEKRSRLRDAVGEWRRSANASVNSSSDMESTPSPVVSTTYSGFAS